MKETIQRIIQALEQASPHLKDVSADNVDVQTLRSQLVAFVAFPNIPIIQSDDSRADVIALRKYLTDHTASFSEKFDVALDPIRNEVAPGWNKTTEEIIEAGIEIILDRAKRIAITNRS